MHFAKPVFKGILTIAIFGMVVLIPLKLVPMVQQWLEDRQAAGTKHQAEVQEEKLHELAPDQADTLVVPDDVYKTLGMTVARVQSPVAPEPLKLDGSLYLSLNSMVHVHSRFAGDVVELGRLEEPSDNPRSRRPLQFGDFVRKKQLLAVVWSKDLGEKKSELVDAIARLRIDEERLKELERLEEKGAISPDKVKERRRLVETDTVDVYKAENTLRSWRVSETEIEAVRAEAEKIHDRNGKMKKVINENWARVEVVSYVDGTIVEKNVAVGDYVSNDLDLFKIADLSRMDVKAHAYEEDLPALERIPPGHRDWSIYLKNDPREEPIPGSFDQIGPIIDPTQHTALVMGWVDNSRRHLRMGQFITAWINLPIPEDEVSIPVSALVDQDGQTFVFVRSTSDPQRYTRRRVFAVRRRDNTVSLSCHSRLHSAGKACDVEPLQVGDWVVTSGGLQLAAELTNLQSQAKSQAQTRQQAREQTQEQKQEPATTKGGV